MDVAHMVLVSLLLAKIMEGLTSTNSRHLETLTNTTRCQSVQGVKVQKRIWRNLMQVEKQAEQAVIVVGLAQAVQRGHHPAAPAGAALRHELTTCSLLRAGL